MGAIKLHARPCADFQARLGTTRALLQRAAKEFAPLKQASSLGAEDVVITHLIDSLGLDIPVFVLDTGLLHAPTSALLARTRASSRAPVEVFHPQETAVVDFVRSEGADAMYRSIALRKACCGIRKLEPLGRALAGQRAWITGLRREQSDARAEVPLVDLSEAAAGGRIKLNPLADWTWGDVWHYIAEHGVDYNPLHDEFFPSIGCAPCTRAISLGEDFRAGRWWWENSETTKECGLHVKPPASDSSLLAVSAQADFAEGEVKALQEAGRSQNAPTTKECGLHVKPPASDSSLLAVVAQTPMFPADRTLIDQDERSHA